MKKNNMKVSDIQECILDDIGYGLLCLSREGEILFMNSKASALFGEAEQKNKNLEKTLAELLRSFPAEKEVNAVIRKYRGRYYSRKSCGTAYGCLVIFEDISSYMAKEMRMDFFIDSVFTGLIITDTKGIVERINRAACELTGLEEDFVKERSFITEVITSVK
ncbi:MAG: PAS domain-containing protein, partial [Fibrobacterota bacterium]